jgi:hypothetical protein
MLKSCLSKIAFLNVVTGKIIKCFKTLLLLKKESGICSSLQNHFKCC